MYHRSFECATRDFYLLRGLFQAQSIFGEFGDVYSVEAAPREVFLVSLLPIDGVDAVLDLYFCAAEHLSVVAELVGRASRGDADACAGDVAPQGAGVVHYIFVF